jgi:iron complex transport system substrate-binding protein
MLLIGFSNLKSGGNFLLPKFIWGLIFISLLFLVSGCAQFMDTDGREGQGHNHFEVVLEDDLGRQLRLSKKPERIISLAPSNTEILFALGLAERIAGVTEYCNYPAEARQKPKAGSFSEPNIEQVVALKPDLVVAASLQAEELVRLEELGIPVLALNPTSIKDVYHSIELLGLAAGEEHKARQLVAEIKARIEAVGEKLSKIPERGRPVRVYYEVYADPLMSIGSACVIHELIEAAGGENIFSDIKEPYPIVSAEAVISRDPEVIIFPDYHGTEGFLANEIKSRPGWGVITAIAGGCIYGLDPDKVSRPGPRIGEAVEELAGLFYPGY